MKLPPSIGLKKIKIIEQVIDELQLEHKPIATENICEQFNELRSDIVLLYELQQALTNLEFELQSLRVRYEAVAPGKVTISYTCSFNLVYPLINLSSLQDIGNSGL